ncbi:MAG: MmgE/PrpD family protein [Burkholderiaceae bacterium]
MNTTASLTQQIAHWACESKLSDISIERQHRAKIALLDFLGCVHAASQFPESESAFVLSQTGSHSIPGKKQTTDLSSAIVAWGTLGALLQWHDGYGRGGNHPSSSILPVLLAHSDDYNALLLPMLVGYEVANRLAANTHPKQTMSGSAPTSSMGAMGSAAALCKFFGLDVATTERAIGLAGFWAPVAAFEGLRNRGNGVPLHSGLAARAGWEAVRAAKSGLSASEFLLEGKNGSGLLQFLGGDFQSLETPSQWRCETMDQVYLKPFPGCRHVHPAVETAMGLFAQTQHLGVKWKSIEIQTYELAVSFGERPQNHFELYDCLMSLPWCVALTLVEGSTSLETIAKDRSRPELQELMSIIAIKNSVQHQSVYPQKLGATLIAIDNKGARWEVTASLEYASASQSFSPQGPYGPVLDEAGVIKKFTELTHSFWSSQVASQIAQNILNHKL